MQVIRKERMIKQVIGDCTLEENEDICPVCGGSKTVKIESPVGPGHILENCQRCSGTGKIFFQESLL